MGPRRCVLADKGPSEAVGARGTQREGILGGLGMADKLLGGKYQLVDLLADFKGQAQDTGWRSIAGMTCGFDTPLADDGLGSW